MDLNELTSQPVVNHKNGVAPIKPQFLHTNNEERVVDVNFISSQDKIKYLETQEKKEPNVNNDNRKRKMLKLKGQNKKRKFNKNKKDLKNNSRPCLRFVASLGNNFNECCIYGDSCFHSHQLSHFLSTRKQDISDHCYLFDKYGFCQYGIVCRYGLNHIDKLDGQSNLMDLEKWNQWKDIYFKQTANHLNKETKIKLRKKTFDFSKSLEAIKGFLCLIYFF